MILLQTQALNANDIMFRVTDLIFIVSGIVTLMTAWFSFKSAQEKNKDRMESLSKEINDKITLEVSRGDEKRAAIKREFEIQQDKINTLEERLNSNENSIDLIETDLGKKMEAFGKEIANVNLSIEKMKSEILTQLLKKK